MSTSQSIHERAAVAQTDQRELPDTIDTVQQQERRVWSGVERKNGEKGGSLLFVIQQLGSVRRSRWE